MTDHHPFLMYSIVPQPAIFNILYEKINYRHIYALFSMKISLINFIIDILTKISKIIQFLMQKAPSTIKNV